MKKLLCLLICIVLLTGCGNGGTDSLKNFKDYNSKKSSYELKGSMKLISNEDEFTYDITVGVKDNKYYKVSLINTISNNEQIILKNDDGVYVITPNLNKSFKFMSEWPNNSSQSYLLESLINDINNDSNASIKEKDEKYYIDALVNYPNNAKLHSETIITDKKYNVENVQVKDEEGNTIMDVKINSINDSPKFSSDYFSLEQYNLTSEDVTEDDCMKECKEDKECKDKCNSKTTSNILDEIIYPLYVPTDTFLSSKDTVNTDNGNRVILTFAGTDPFILVEEASVKNTEMEVIPVSGEPIILGSTIGALSNNSIYWTNNGVDYYLTSNTLDSKEMLTIAESITNASTLVASTK